MKKGIRIAALLLALTLVLPTFAFAAEGEDIVGGTYVTIGSAEDFYTDELDGVKAYPYNQCNDLAIRYYAEIYGIDIFVGDNSPVLMDYAFDIFFSDAVSDIGDVPDEMSGFTRITDTPEKGDIVYWSATRRGKSYAHTALVKSYDAEKQVITLIEQNWNSGGKAAFERKVKFPSNYYYVYRLTDRPIAIGTEVPVRVSPHGMICDGEQVYPLGYNIDGNNYYMLRDLAAMLSGTSVSFSVDYDAVNDEIIFGIGELYDAASGGVNREPASTGIRTGATISAYYEGEYLGYARLFGYNINDNNYFKLRDVAYLLGFGVTYDAEAQMVVVDSTVGYTPEE